MDETLGGGWESWVQKVGTTLADGYVSANYTQPFELQKLRIQAQGQGGGYYAEGMPAPVARPLGGISPMILILAGAAVVALVLLRD